MKFVAISALVATVSAAGGVYDYKVCTKTADSKTTTSKCCMSNKTGGTNSGDYICAPTSPTTIPNGVAIYAGYTIDCSKSPSVDATGAKSLAASTVSVLTAAYLLS